MALVFAERIKETTTTTGTGTLNLSGAATGFRTFVAGVGNGNSCRYTIDDGAGNWEVGTGVVTDGSPDTLTRPSGSVIASSNGGSAVNFGAGSKDVFLAATSEDVLPSAWALVTVTAGTPALTANKNVSGIVDDGAGTLTLQWEPDFASGDYALVATTDVGASDTFVQTLSHLAATAQIVARNLSGTNTDPAEYHVNVLGI